MTTLVCGPLNALQIFAAKNYTDGDMAYAILDEDDKPVWKTLDEFRQHCGDSLFVFVINELDNDLLEDEDDGWETAELRMRAAARQLSDLADAIERASPAWAP